MKRKILSTALLILLLNTLMLFTPFTLYKSEPITVKALSIPSPSLSVIIMRRGMSKSEMVKANRETNLESRVNEVTASELQNARGDELFNIYTRFTDYNYFLANVNTEYKNFVYDLEGRGLTQEQKDYIKNMDNEAKRTYEQKKSKSKENINNLIITMGVVVLVGVLIISIIHIEHKK